MKCTKYVENLRKLYEVMESRPDIVNVNFNREENSFDVVSENGGVHVCFCSEFENGLGTSDESGSNDYAKLVDGVTVCCGYDFGTDVDRVNYCPVCGRRLQKCL